MQNYLLTVLVKNELDEKARGAILDAIKKQFDNLGKEDLWGTRTLSYPIQHMDKAYFAHYEFQAEENKISTLDKSIKLNEDIIRHLLLRKDDKKVRPAKGRRVVIEAKSSFAEASEGKEEPVEEKSEAVAEVTPEVKD